MKIELLTFGHGLTCSYLVSCEETHEAMIIDPYFSKEDSDDLLGRISTEGVVLRYIFNTHGHPDHMSGNHWLKRDTNAKILIHKSDTDMLATPWKPWETWDLSIPRLCPICHKKVRRYLEVEVAEGYAEVGCTNCSFAMRAYPSPPGDVLLEHEDVIQLGHTRFQVIHTPGHTQGSVCLYNKEAKLIFTGDTEITSSGILMEIPDSTIVYPGHGESTTIGDARIAN